MKPRLVVLADVTVRAPFPSGRRFDFASPLRRFPGGLLALVLLFTGCSTVRLPPADFTSPGWEVRQTQAVWRPNAAAPELIGELLVAGHPDGRRLVQFSKQGLPVVTAQTTADAWQIGSSLRRRIYSGRGAPPDRVPWFQVTRLPPVASGSARWRLETQPDGSWRLDHAASGERLEGAALLAEGP